MIGASGLSDDGDNKNDGLKWKLAESFLDSGITFLPLSCYHHFVAADEAVFMYCAEKM